MKDYIPVFIFSLMKQDSEYIVKADNYIFFVSWLMQVTLS
jgi:hypothetical protein